VGLLIYLAFLVFEIAALWLVFVKAERPGWGAIIPLYNVYLICKVAKRPGWWLILFLIPLVNIVVAFIVFIDMAKAFGKGAGFGVLLTLFGFVCMPILGFGAATYDAGPAAA
jgi:hypothetical protein